MAFLPSEYSLITYYKQGTQNDAKRLVIVKYREVFVIGTAPHLFLLCDFPSSIPKVVRS